MIRTKREQRNYDIVWETYDLLFRASEPSIGFDDLVHKSGYEDKNGNPVECDHYLTDDELHEKGLVRSIPFMSYEIDKATAMSIVKSQCKKYKLNKSEQQGLEMNVWLGCAPKFKKEVNEKR